MFMKGVSVAANIKIIRAFLIGIYRYMDKSVSNQIVEY